MLVTALTFVLVFSLSQSLPIRHQYRDFRDLTRNDHMKVRTLGWWCNGISRGGESHLEQPHGEEEQGSSEEERREWDEPAEMVEMVEGEHDRPKADLWEDEGREEEAAYGSDETVQVKDVASEGYDAAESRRLFSDILAMGAAVTKHAVLGTAEVLNPFKMTSSLNTSFGEEVYQHTLKFWKRIPMPQPVTTKLSQVTRVMADRLVHALADAGVIMYDYLPSMTSDNKYSDTKPTTEEGIHDALVAE